MMETTIIFHSVCGNTFLMAKKFRESFKDRGKNVKLLRVKDDSLEESAKMFEAAKEFYSDIIKLPVANPEDMLNSDLVILGSPTYFGNVSAQMKAFMDSCAGLWVQAKFVGKKLAAFTSAANPEGGGDLCLQSIHTFGRHMGMMSMSVPSNLVPGTTIPAYGIIHYSGGPADKRPDENGPVIPAYVDFLLKYF